MIDQHDAGLIDFALVAMGCLGAIGVVLVVISLAIRDYWRARQ